MRDEKSSATVDFVYFHVLWAVNLYNYGGLFESVFIQSTESTAERTAVNIPHAKHSQNGAAKKSFITVHIDLSMATVTN